MNDARDQESLTVFKDEKAELAFMSAYDRVLESWPVPYESRFVPTTYGKTHVLVTGPEDAEPLVLMHGKNGTAAMWGANIAALSSAHRVYSVDAIGDVGKSNATRVFSDRAGLAEWLTEVLDGLGIEKADMVGLSVGGFLTASYALEMPDRLNKIVLLAPAATFSSLARSFVIQGMLSGMTGSSLIIKRFIRSIVGSKSLHKSDLLHLLFLSMKGERFIMRLPPRALSDEELKSLRVPVLFVVGEKEWINKDKATRAIERAERLIENIQTAIVPNVVHFINIEDPEFIDSATLNFLSGDE